MHFNHSPSKDGRRVYHRFIDYGKFTLNSCHTPPIKLRPKQVEDAVLNAMRERVEQLSIAKSESSKPNFEIERVKAKIVRIDGEIQKLMEKHDLAAALIEVVNISDETGIKVKFCI